MVTRRRFLEAGGLALLYPRVRALPGAREAGVLVNDVHSQLTATRVHAVVQPDSLAGIVSAVHSAAKAGRAVCIAGGRHAMGAQPFATDGLLIDVRRLNKVLSFDHKLGTIEVEAGIQWPELADYLVSRQAREARAWGFAQKQTGADRLTLGGCLAANVHGRGLAMKPFVTDVESFRLVDARGELVRCSRSDNAERFRLAIGGYGLFGVIYSVTLRLVPRRKVRRAVEVIDVEQAIPAFRRRIEEGFLYGDFQYAINERSEALLRRGVFSCYRPVDASTPIPVGQRELGEESWRELLELAHTDEEEAFRRYSSYYLSTSGQVYWSDTHQMSIYPDGYHADLDRRRGGEDKATEMITEIYVDRDALPQFMAAVAEDFRRNRVEVIYGTVRLIERDEETFLAWAKKPYACIIFNLHVVHTDEGIRRSADTFRRLIDHGRRFGGSYYLTYHRWATKEQVLACYPEFPEFLALKRKHDPKEVFQSDWYRHYRTTFASA